MTLSSYMLGVWKQWDLTASNMVRHFCLQNCSSLSHENSGTTSGILTLCCIPLRMTLRREKCVYLLMFLRRKRKLHHWREIILHLYKFCLLNSQTQRNQQSHAFSVESNNMRRLSVTLWQTCRLESLYLNIRDGAASACVLLIFFVTVYRSLESKCFKFSGSYNSAICPNEATDQPNPSRATPTYFKPQTQGATSLYVTTNTSVLLETAQGVIRRPTVPEK